MIADFQFGTRLLRPAIESAPADAVEVSSLDATEDVPLCAALWVREDGSGFHEPLTERDAVRGATPVAEGEMGSLYRVRCEESFDGTDVYRVAVEEGGIFLSGEAARSAWTLQLRFPGRDAIGAFRDRCEAAGVDVSVDALYECEVAPRAAQFCLTEPQRRALAVAAREGYFDVPRETSLSGLADELGVSSQAASERIRRGLDSLVEETLVTGENGSFTR